MNSVEVVLTRLEFWVQAGQFHSGMESIAMEGANNVNVPPWRMGSLEKKMIKIHWGGEETREGSQTDVMSGQEPF